MVNSIITAIILLLLAAAAYCYMLAKLKGRVTFFRNCILLPATFMSGFILYFIGYITNPEADMIAVVTFKSIYATVMMMLMESSIDDMSDVMRENNIYMLLFTISHFLGLLLAVTTALSLFGRRINASIRMMTSFNRECFVLFNINEESLTLAEDMLRNDTTRDVFFVGEVGESVSPDLFDRIESIGAYYVDNSTAQNEIGGDLIFRHIIKKRSRLIYISPNEDKNISAVLHIFALLNGLPARQKEAAQRSVSIYIQIDSEDMVQIFEEARADMGITIEYSIFSVPEIISTQLIRSYQPTKYVTIDQTQATATNNYEVMVIGFGRNGRSILRRVIENGQFVGSDFRAIVVDQAINTKLGSFDANYPSILPEYNIETVADSVGSPSFFQLLKRESTTLQQIIISLSSDSLNVKTAIEIDKILRSIGCDHIDIIVVIRQSNNYLYLHNSNKFKSINCIGQNQDIFTESIIIDESLWSNAKATHEYYNLSKAPERRLLWENLESIKRQSNISAASHIMTKLELMGLSPDALRQMSKEEYIALLKSNPLRYENLARTEHLRWNAAYFIRGWKCWALSDIPDATVNQDHRLKSHACLVSWEDLVAVEEFFGGEPYQRYDYDNIDAIYELICNDVLK